MHIVKITPNLIFEYQCTSGKFIRLPNRIEKIDSVAKIESNRIETFFCPNWNALVGCWRGYLYRARRRLAYGPADATATHCLLLQ